MSSHTTTFIHNLFQRQSGHVLQLMWQAEWQAEYVYWGNKKWNRQFVYRLISRQNINTNEHC